MLVFMLVPIHYNCLDGGKARSEQSPGSLTSESESELDLQGKLDAIDLDVESIRSIYQSRTKLVLGVRKWVA
jgi:hypothetical protein